MRHLVKILIPILALSQTAIASEEGITITPKGRFDFTLGVIDHKAHKKHGTKNTKLVSGNRDNFAFLSTASFLVNVKNQVSEDIAYGAQISLQTSSRSDRKYQSHLFFESNIGKWELGSDKSAATKMKITGLTNASATAGCWDMWVKSDIRDYGIQYVTSTGGFLDTKTRNVKDSEYSRKITYYTPEFYGFQAGLSYIPDSTNIGETPLSDPTYHMHNKMTGYKFDIKDGFGWGVTKAHKFENGLSAKLAVVGELGKVVPKFIAPEANAFNRPEEVQEAKFKKLRSYTVGAELKYGPLAVSGCYMDYMKSFTADGVDQPGRKKSNLYNVGAKYSFEKLSVSAHYFHSNHKKNKVNATTLAVDYKIAPGLLPYAEVTAYNSSGWYKATPNDPIKTDTHKGAVLLTGIRLEF